jgi:hypothetical protein
MLAGGRAIGQYNNMVNGVMAKTLQNRNVYVFFGRPLLITNFF